MKACGLAVEVVVIRDPLRRGFRIVAARAVVVVQHAAQLLLIAESDFVEPQFHRLAGFVARGGHDLVSSGAAAQGHYCDVNWPSDAGEARIRRGHGSAGGVKFYQRAGDRGSLRVIHLHDDWLIQRRRRFRRPACLRHFGDSRAEGLGGAARAAGGERWQPASTISPNAAQATSALSFLAHLLILFHQDRRSARGHPHRSCSGWVPAFRGAGLRILSANGRSTPR